MSDVDAAVNRYFGAHRHRRDAELDAPGAARRRFASRCQSAQTGYIVVDLDSGRYLMAGDSDDRQRDARRAASSTVG